VFTIVLQFVFQSLELLVWILICFMNSFAACVKGSSDRVKAKVRSPRI
jgi:hypothetical protein